MKNLQTIFKKFDIRRFSVFRRLPLLLSLTRRAVFFFISLLIAQIFLFLTGNIQNFLDENLRLILFFCSATSLCTSFFSLAACIECIFFLIRQKKHFFLIHFINFFVIFLITFILPFLINSIGILGNGNF